MLPYYEYDYISGIPLGDLEEMKPVKNSKGLTKEHKEYEYYENNKALIEPRQKNVQR